MGKRLLALLVSVVVAGAVELAARDRTRAARSRAEVDLLAGVRAVLAHDPRPRVFTAAAERARFRARMLFLLLVAALGLVAHRAIKARRDARLRALGELPAQTTR